MTLKDWKKTDIYQHFYQYFGLTRQMVIMLPAESTILIGVALNRERRDFSEHDRELLRLMQPHLIQAYKNASGHTEVVDHLSMLSDTMDSLHIGVVLTSNAGRIKHASDLALHSLESFFPDFSSQKMRLPQELVDWLDSGEDAISEKTGHSPHWDVDREHGRLRISRIHRESGQEKLISIERYTRSRNPHNLMAFDISEREAEVLYWIAQGKKNSEIAIVLGISPRTVEKHVQKIYRALRVESRTQATIRAVNCLMQARSDPDTCQE